MSETDAPYGTDYPSGTDRCREDKVNTGYRIFCIYCMTASLSDQLQHRRIFVGHGFIMDEGHCTLYRSIEDAL